MKKLLFYFLFIIYSAAGFAQLSAVDSTITGHITQNRVLSSSKKYLLSGFVYVDSTVSLTIPAGTVIFGEKATKGSLIVKRGAKLYALGTAVNPIVFTSQNPVGLRQPGDWGGVIVCGAASNNQSLHQLIEGGVEAYYGGTDDADNSGIIRFVRIEFAGIAFQPNNEINGLTMGSVGSGTTIENVQVSYSGDDGFEWFGGTVNCKNLIAYKNLDDDFDTDFGFRGKVQFGVIVRDPYLADQSKSEAFESDNDGSGTLKTPRTQPVFSNITVIGPKQTYSSTLFNPNFYYAVHERRSTLQSIRNSVFTGFPNGFVYLDGNNVTNATTNDTILFRDNIYAGMIAGGTTNSAFNIYNWVKNATYSNDSVSEAAGLLLKDPFNQLNPNVVPNTGSPVLGQANFTGLTDPFWSSVTYAGAFDASNNRWDAGWSNYDPQSKSYSSSVSWTSTIKLSNSINETRTAVFGKASGATNDLDGSLGESALPPALPDDIDIRFELPVSGTPTVSLDLRTSAYSFADSVVTYTVKLQPGTSHSGNVTLSWNPNELGAGEFFVSDSLGGFVFATTNMKTSSSVTFPCSGETYVYIYNRQVFTQILNVGDKWNLVSFPGRHLNSMSVDTLYRSRTAGKSVWGYNGSYSSVTTMSNGNAYWLHHNGGKNYTWNSTVQSNVLYPKLFNAVRNNIAVSSGWNLIGSYEYSVQTTGITTIPFGLISGTIYGYTPGSGYSATTLLEPGKGYWVNVTASGLISLPGPFSGTLKQQEALSIDNNWTKIIVTDKNNSSYTLYLSKDKSVSEAYNLPPAPPAEIFDVRFASGKFVESSKYAQDIELNGVEYPVKVRVENGSIIVREAGSNNVTLAQGSEYVISNSSASTLSILTTESVPADFNLAQNYPNPFNPSTSIKFSIPVNSVVKLTIYNALGQQVEELVNNFLEAGNYDVKWNASKHSSGIYFYELKSNNFTAVKKMMLVK